MLRVSERHSEVIILNARAFDGCTWRERIRETFMTTSEVFRAESIAFHLRTFTMENHEQVVDLWRRAGIKVGPSDSREGISRRLQRDEDLFLVATDAGGCVV